jgi:ABC-type polysaccharide/polyol phosphate export permease
MAFGGSATRHGRLATLAGAAVIGALLTDTFAGPVIGAIPTSKFLVLWGIFILVMTAVAFATSALQTVLGAAGTLVVVVVFVIFGAPASGGTVPTPYLPGFWRTLGPYLPAGAGTTVVRNTIYFDGTRIAASVVVLAAYLVVGAVAVLVIRRRRSSTGPTAEAEAAAAAAAVV